MSYNILGINTSHNGSVCVLKNGEIDFFLEEERVSRNKADSIPFNILQSISQKYSIDKVAVAGLTHLFTPSLLQSFLLNLKLLFPKAKIYNFLDDHHLSHVVSSFNNCKFNKCLGIVIDGNGSYINMGNNEYKTETESAFLLDTQTLPQCIYNSSRLLNLGKSSQNFSSEEVSLSKVYECITTSLGFRWDESGKTMGLSSYGSQNHNIPSLYKGFKGNKEIIESSINTTNGNLKKKYNYLLNSKNLRKDLAFKVQQESQKKVGDLVEKLINQTGLKQVCCAGGYFLNCVANYYLTKRFPDVEFYFEPISSDAGVSIGAAKLVYYIETKDTTIRPQKTLYYGPQYSKEELLNGIKQYL